MLDTTLQAMPRTKARAGITWFKNAAAQAVVCEPSRAGIFTGQNDKRHGVINNPDDKRFREADTIATWLHGAGYRTGLVEKTSTATPSSVAATTRLRVGMTGMPMSASSPISGTST